jgi:hypothetical protein
MQAKRVSVGALVALLALAANRLDAQRTTIQLRVVDDTGSALMAGEAGIQQLGRFAPIVNGTVTIPDVPDGTWMVSIRAIGFRPESVSVRAPVTTPLRPVNMHRIPQPLAPVAVVSQRDSAVMEDIRRRMLVASGTLITADNLSVRNSTYATDAIRIARGFTWKSPTRVQTRGTTGGIGGSARCESLPTSDSVVPRRGRGPIRKVVVVYLDGTRLPGGLESINRMVPVSDILAIETYSDVLSAPFLWRTNDACAVIAYWTKRPPKVSVGR